MSQHVDAILIEHRLGLRDGSIVAAEIKQLNPQVPIVMLAENTDLPDDAFKSVDALVTKSDGAHFLLAIIHFVLSVKPAQRQQEKLRAPTSVHLRRPGRSRGSSGPMAASYPQPAIDRKGAPLSPRMWRSIRSGIIQFD